MAQPYTPPTFQGTAFNCPHCNAYAKQFWYRLQVSNRWVSNLMYCECDHCQQYALWRNEKMIYPDESIAPLPADDLPSDIKRDYEEARSIISRSPRGSAALLRLCIQKLCGYLGENGKNIDDDIASLVEKGLPVRVQQSLDVVRVIGNNAVHPGQIDLRDDQETSVSLCKLVNFIVEKMITEPKAVEEMYGKLPASALAHIEKRDGKNND